VDRYGQDVIAGVENILCPVAMVKIHVQHRDMAVLTQVMGRNC
jgi:hypothetical protein